MTPVDHENKSGEGSITRKLYSLVGVVAGVLVVTVMISIWSANTLSMITAIARFERTHTVSRNKAISDIKSYTYFNDNHYLDEYKKHIRLPQSYNDVFGRLLELNNNKSNDEFVRIIEDTFAEADHKMAEIIVSRIGILYWHPLIKDLIQIAQAANADGEKYEGLVQRLQKAGDLEKQKQIFQEIEAVSKAMEASEVKFSEGSGELTVLVSTIVKGLMVFIFLCVPGTARVLKSEPRLSYI